MAFGRRAAQTHTLTRRLGDPRVVDLLGVVPSPSLSPSLSPSSLLRAI
jgi:hypothetical protein